MEESKTKAKKGGKKEKSIDELKAQLARALADYDNLRKRVEQEKEVWIRYSSERILVKLLPILDIFESAQVHLKDQGLAIAITEFKKLLAEEGIEEIRPNVNDKFDPSLHEVVESLENGKKGHIAEVVLVGWKFKGGKVIRYAKVKVYGEKVEKKEELEKEIARGEYM